MVRFALAVRRGGFDFGAANGVLLLACLLFGSWQVVPEKTATMRSTQARGRNYEPEENDGHRGRRQVSLAGAGRIFGSPAPVFLTWGHEWESALERLVDVFRIGVRGQAFRDFLEAGRKQGRSEAEIVEKWKGCERAVVLCYLPKCWPLERLCPFRDSLTLFLHKTGRSRCHSPLR